MRRSFPLSRRIGTSALALAILTSATGRVSAAEPIPPKTVVLTFDDAVKSQLEVVAPLLKQYGFGATFFISHAWMEDAAHFMSWEEVAKLHQMGFEIGNHTWTHSGFNTPRLAARLAGELALVENELVRVGVPKPISFAWPGNDFGPAALAVLEKAGYRLGRRGMQPEAPYASLELGPLFDPQRYQPLLIPSAGDAYPNWTLEHFKEVVDRAGPGHAAVIQFHGVPDVAHPWVNTPVERFSEYLHYLKQGSFHVIALRDLLPYLPVKPISNDPMAQTEYPVPSVAFGAQVKPQADGADFELWLKNGTASRLTKLRTQICLLLKAAPGFSEQNQERKRYEAPLVVVKARNADRYLLLAFEDCGRAWGNAQCPCVHSDPVLPEAASGERVSVQGLLRFYEGKDIQAAKQTVLDQLRVMKERRDARP
jgi:peptidoglycan/xylan/chitin deacetylase (PgdA/CDA1 family)